jgi:sugar phosphate isomerase/epimerase
MGTDPDEARLTTNFARLCEAAAGFGLRVGLEFAAYTHTPDIHAARRIVSAAGQPNGGVLIDSLHLVRSGGTAADVASLAPTSITGFQLADGRGPRPASNEALRAEARGGRFFPGNGEFPLAAILGALPAGMPLCVETPCAQYASLPVRQRARLCAEQTRKFLASGDKP